jgi:peroxiredoxin (alkyl hydroperoxide reductase subunit C)
VAKQYRNGIGEKNNMEEEKSMPLIGEKFPDMEVQTTHGKKKLPEEYKGKWFVLFSHPADFTPVCMWR